MAFQLIRSLQNIWPLSVFKYDDLRASNELVRTLPVPESTKRFVFAVRVPEHQSVIYILSAQNLSERSALDAETLVREIRPDAVVTQLGNSSINEILSEESELGDNLSYPVPTSSVEVLMRCFLDKVNKEKYENMAGSFVLREIFGTSFHGHVLAAKRMAKEVGSTFMVLESSFVKTSKADSSCSDSDKGSLVQGLVGSLVPQTIVPLVSSSRRLFITNDVQNQMAKLLSSHMSMIESKFRPSSAASVSDSGLKETKPAESYEVPSFAQSVYPLLVDLHDIFVDLPSIGRALTNARKMLFDVNRGEVVDARIISEVYLFRIAVEGLRIALNSAGRLSMKELWKVGSENVDFSQLKFEDKSHALIAQTLKSQAEKFKSIVAVVDASSLAGLRKHWNTPVPSEVKGLVGQLVSICDSDESPSNHSKLKQLLSDKPIVAVGTGATAALGASSLSKVVPASTLMKIGAFKVPASLKLFLTQTQKIMATTLSKSVGQTKVMVPGLATSGSNTSTLYKAIASAEKIRAVTHSIIASVEKTSFSAMRTAFYEIMRKRRVRQIGFLPWATFGCSMATCSGLVMYGDGIECAAESFPSARSIACLGRGIQSLHEASQMVTQADGNRIQKSIESLLHRLKKIKIQ